jgi:thiamine biosynthesis lipoprotein ApbE
MKDVRIIMGMPIEIEIIAPDSSKALESAFGYLHSVDERFSTYKEESEISRINRGEIAHENSEGRVSVRQGHRDVRILYSRCAYLQSAHAL